MHVVGVLLVLDSTRDGRWSDPPQQVSVDAHQNGNAPLLHVPLGEGGLLDAAHFRHGVLRVDGRHADELLGHERNRESPTQRMGTHVSKSFTWKKDTFSDVKSNEV